MHEKFLNAVIADLNDNALKPKCECACAPERKIESLVVMAMINGEPVVWDASAKHDLSIADSERLLDRVYVEDHEWRERQRA